MAGIAASVYLGVKNYPIASEMFNKSIHNSNSKISKSLQDKIVNKTKNTPQVQDAIKKCVSSSNGKSFSNCDGSFEYTTGDLYYSIQHCNYTISGNVISNGNWNINVKLYDNYNFDEFRDGWSTGALANNLGVYMQMNGMLKEYYWDVKYSLIYKSR